MMIVDAIFIIFLMRAFTGHLFYIFYYDYY